MIERSRTNLNELLNNMSEDNMNLAGEMRDSKNSQAWGWSVAESKNWSSQSWNQSWSK